MTVAEGPAPQPRAGEVLIEVAYAGVNRPDCAQRAGTYPPPPDASPILGLEVAGTRGGLRPERDVLESRRRRLRADPRRGLRGVLRRRPPRGACRSRGDHRCSRRRALPENYFTVWNNVFDRGRLAAGETLLVHGGTSGIGLATIQLAKAVRRDGVHNSGQRRQGCVLPRHRRRPRDQLQDAGLRGRGRADHRQAGVDVILDMVGGDYIAEEPEVPGARRPAGADRLPEGQPGRGRLDAASCCAGSRSPARRCARARRAQGRARARAAREVWPLFESGKLKTVIHASSARRGRRRARADGVVAARRQDHAGRQAHIVGTGRQHIFLRGARECEKSAHSMQ